LSPAILRTPDACFAGLPAFPFAPHYLTVTDEKLGSLRMHYLDEGVQREGVVLMLHGEPSWSFLYRKIIGPVVNAGWRAIAPDHIGFGRSDKPADRGAFSIDAYVDWLRQLVEGLDLQHIVLLCQDWGGPIGLRLLSEMPGRFAGVMATNTVLPTAEPPPRGVAGWPGPIIAPWIELCQTSDDLPISEIIAATCVNRPAPEVLAAYDAPFPNASYKAAALAITTLIPTRADAPGVAQNKAAWAALEKFEKPFATAFSDCDPATAPWEAVFRARIPGATAAPHVRIAGAGHFVQEEQDEALSAALLALLSTIRR
jgi:haloalkane dehalogenase